MEIDEKAQVCQSCGAVVTAWGRFCGSCGMPLDCRKIEGWPTPEWVDFGAAFGEALKTGNMEPSSRSEE